VASPTTIAVLMRHRGRCVRRPLFALSLAAVFAGIISSCNEAPELIAVPVAAIEIDWIETAAASGEEPLEIAEALVLRMGDPRTAVRRRALLAVARSIDRAVNGVDPRRRAEVAAAVERLVGALCRLYDAETDAVARDRIVWAAALAPFGRSAELIRRAAESEHAYERSRAARGLARLGGPESVEATLRLLRDPDVAVRTAATLELARQRAGGAPWWSDVSGASDLLYDATRRVAIDTEFGPRSESLRHALVRTWVAVPEWRDRVRGDFARWLGDENWLIAGTVARSIRPVPSRLEIDAVIAIAERTDVSMPARFSARRSLVAWVEGGRLERDTADRCRQALEKFPGSEIPRPTLDMLARLRSPRRSSETSSEIADPVPSSWLIEHVVVLEVVGKGQIVVRLFLRDARSRVGELVRRLRDEVVRAEITADGSAIVLRGESDASVEPRSVLRAIHSDPIERGVIIGSESFDRPGGFAIVLEPRPDLDDQATVLGSVALGPQLLESITTGDTVRIHVADASDGELAASEFGFRSRPTE
jgi:hypothetical protein